MLHAIQRTIRPHSTITLRFAPRNPVSLAQPRQNLLGYDFGASKHNRDARAGMRARTYKVQVVDGGVFGFGAETQDVEEGVAEA